MSPLEMSILIHYHCHPSDFRNGDFSAPAVRRAIDYFLEKGFLKVSTNKYQTLEATEGCTAYVNHLRNQPLPTLKWGY